jgi:hypothetical protein
MIKGQTYVEHLEESNFPLRKRSRMLNPGHALLRSMSGLEGINSRVVCTVLVDNMHVLEVQRRQALSDRDGDGEECASLALIVPVRVNDKKCNRTDRRHTMLHALHT